MQMIDKVNLRARTPKMKFYFRVLEAHFWVLQGV